jgi:HEPN domain-containing protein
MAGACWLISGLVIVKEDYLSAALRHHHDANLLLESGRLDNAAYLAGYIVECSLKALIQSGEEIGGRSLGHDLPNIAGGALVLAVLIAPGIQRYLPDIDPDLQHVLDVWEPDWRYAATGQVSEDEARRLIRGGKVSIDRVLLPLVLDGVLGLPR